MIYNTNQNRQFYVANSYKTGEPTAEGDVMMGKTADGKQIWFKHFGKGGLTRTDIIDVDKISYIKHSTKASMQRKLKQAKVTLNPDVNEGKLIPGQDYVLRVEVKNFFSPGDASVYIKSNVVRAVKGMTETQFYTKLKESLIANFSREKQTSNMEFFKFTSDATGVTITEVEQPWRLGILSQEPVNFEVIPLNILENGEEVTWGKVTISDTNTTVGNGKQIADLEFFCMGERGDMFRGMGYPYNIDVKYMVDPTKEYDVLDIHYAYSGDGVQVHKSEKDLTFVSSTTATITSIKNAIEALL